MKADHRCPAVKFIILQGVKTPHHKLLKQIAIMAFIFSSIFMVTLLFPKVLEEIEYQEALFLTLYYMPMLELELHKINIKSIYLALFNSLRLQI